MKLESLEIIPKQDLDHFMGVICPIHWDANGKADGFSIYNSHDEVIITNPSQIKNLSSYIGKKVKAYGQFYFDQNDDPSMKVKFLKKCNFPHPRSFDLWNNEEFEVFIPRAS